jgi:hypothetical protein
MRVLRNGNNLYLLASEIKSNNSNVSMSFYSFAKGEKHEQYNMCVIAR